MTAGHTYPTSRGRTCPTPHQAISMLLLPYRFPKTNQREPYDHFIAYDPNVPTTLTFTLVGGSNDNDFFNLKPMVPCEQVQFLIMRRMHP